MSREYYNHPNISNSDLTNIDREMSPEGWRNYAAALRRGSLLDALILWGNVYFLSLNPTSVELSKLQPLKKAYDKDPWCQQVHNTMDKQVAFYEPLTIQAHGLTFTLQMKCLYDYYSHIAKFGGDLKRTAATSQSQFEEHCFDTFDYLRARALYMDISKSDKDFIIGINEKGAIFKIWIRRGDELYIRGRESYSELAFKYYMLYGEKKMQRQQVLQ